MSNTTLTIKTPKKLRDEAKKTAAQMGIPLTTVVNAMLRQFVLDKTITFSAKVPNAETRKALMEARTRKNVETFKTFKGWKESMRSM